MARILTTVLPSLVGIALLSSCAGSSASRQGEPDLPEVIRNLPPETRRALAKDAFLQSVWLDLEGQDLMSVDYLQEAAWNDPNDRWLQFRLASRLREFRRSSEALALARRAMTLPGEEESEQWGLLAGLWLEAGARDSAKACWTRMVELDPRAREGLVGLATLAESRGELDEAASRYAAISEEYGEAGRAIVARAVALWMKSGRSDSATALLRRRWMARREIEDGESLARLLSSRGFADSAVHLYDSLAEIPDAESSHMRIMAARVWLLNNHLDSARARLEPMAMQGFVEARISLGALYLDLDSLERARAIFAPLVDHSEHGALACHYLGLLASRNDGFDSARHWYDESLRKDPKRSDTWVRRGLLEIDAGKPDSAGAIFSRMTRLWPDFPQPRWLLAHALARSAQTRSVLKEWESPAKVNDSLANPYRLEALAQLDTALQLDPNLGSARFERAALLERLGRRDSAYAEFRRIVAGSPGDPVASNYLAYMLAEDSTELDFADSLVSRSLQTDSVNSAYLDTRGWIRHRQGRNAEARADVERSIAMGEDDPVVLEHRAVILEALGLRDEALKAWRDLLEKAPDHPRARERSR